MDTSLQFSNILCLCGCSLPSSEDADSSIEVFGIKQEYIDMVGESAIQDIAPSLVDAQYRTRERVEPILAGILEVLNSFDIKEN